MMDGTEPLLQALRAAADPSRLRLLVLCAESDLSVSELVRIVGQSQPRVSRHLKVLTEAGLLERVREGNWGFYRLVSDGFGPVFAAGLFRLLPENDDTIAGDMERLAEVRRQREQAASNYFSANAEAWDKLRSLHVDDAEVERVLLDLMPSRGARRLLDIGTGTARMLELFGPRVGVAEGIDASHDMLAVARANLQRTNLDNCTVRQADIYQLPFPAGHYDAITAHQVLHFLDRPAQAIAEAARVLKPGGWMLLVDFAPHGLDALRDEHAHRRLGFDDDEVKKWLNGCGLTCTVVEHLRGDPLTVTVWLANKT
ncbi:MAG: ArsR/SmtB family transcription factor [Alphaproteobacteria bacterium]